MTEAVEFIRVENAETLKNFNFDGYVGQVILDCRWLNPDETYKRLALYLDMLNKREQVFAIIVKDKSMFHELENRCRDRPEIVKN